MTTQRGAYGRFIASRSEPGMGCVRGNASTAAPEARGRPKMGGCGSGTIAGAAAIDPRHLALRTPAPPVWLEGLMFDNRPVPVSSGARLGPGAGRLEIQFTAPSFAAASRILFRYRLEGFDKEWIEAGARRTAYYTNVPPGSYRFQVEAAASDGGWSGKGADLKLELRPHVYQTAWFRGLCAALLVVCGAGLYLLRVRYLLWRNRELERKVAQRTEELAKTARSLAAEKSELLRARAELERLATRDGLTGIWNRRAAFDLLGCALDGFKRINDRHGHPAGDGVLREIARRLQARVRAEQLRREVEDAPVEVG